MLAFLAISLLECANKSTQYFVVIQPTNRHDGTKRRCVVTASEYVYWRMRISIPKTTNCKVHSEHTNTVLTLRTSIIITARNCLSCEAHYELHKTQLPLSGEVTIHETCLGIRNPCIVPTHRICVFRMTSTMRSYFGE
jgi:hypothetical protein